MKLLRWTPERLDKLRELLIQKKPTQEIAAYFGVDEFAIRQAMYRHKIKRGDRGAKSKLEGKHEEKVRTDLATRIRILKGEEKKEDTPHFGFTDDQIRRWLTEPQGYSLFCKEVLGVQLQDYQRQMFDLVLNYPRCCFVIGRQGGKDFTIACLTLWLTITKSNQKILLISPAQRQSDLLYDRILTFIGLNNELFNSVEKSNSEMCKFTNNSVIKSLPSTTFIRGETGVTLAIMNEARDFFDGNSVMASVLPMLAIEKGSLVIMSSASGCSGLLWDCFNHPIFQKLQLPTTVNKFITAVWIEEQRQILPTNYFEMEFMAQFSEAVDSFFPVSLIQKCSKPYDFTHFREEGKKYYLGIDWGRVRDASVFTVVSVDCDGVKKVENIIELTNTPFSSQIEHIKLLHETYNFNKITAEKAGLSLPLVERLHEEGLPVMPFEPTLDNKIEAFNHILTEMEKGNVVIPSNHTKLQHELRTFRYEITTQGKAKLHHASEYGSDDFVDSLCFAVWGTRKPDVEFFIGPDISKLCGYGEESKEPWEM